MQRKHRGSRKLVVVLLGLFLVAAASLGCSGKNPDDVSGARPGQKAGAVGSSEDTHLAADNSESGRNGGPRVTFIELGSDSCVPCTMMREVMDEIERLYGDQVSIVFHDVWTEAGRPYAQQYDIRVIPTQVFLDSEGDEYFRHEGYLPLEQAAEILAREGVERRR